MKKFSVGSFRAKKYHNIDLHLNYSANTCVQDCVGALPCGGIVESWDEVFSDKKTWCGKKLWWEDQCLTRYCVDWSAKYPWCDWNVHLRVRVVHFVFVNINIREKVNIMWKEMCYSCHFHPHSDPSCFSSYPSCDVPCIVSNLYAQYHMIKIHLLHPFLSSISAARWQQTRSAKDQVKIKAIISWVR